MIGLRNGRSGFTLIELMVVIIILGILAAIAIPKYMVARDRARATEAIQEIGVLAGEIQAQYQITDAYATDLTKIGYGNSSFTNANFSYSLTGNANDATIMATSLTGGTKNETITLNVKSQKWDGTYPGAPHGKL